MTPIFQSINPVWDPEDSIVFSRMVAISRRYSNFQETLWCTGHRGSEYFTFWFGYLNEIKAKYGTSKAC